MEPLKKAMQGGACQATDQPGGLGANPITHLFDQMISGDQMARQFQGNNQMAGLDPASQRMMEQQYQAMMGNQQMENQFQAMQNAQPIHFQAQARPQNDVLNALWDSTGSMKGQSQFSSSPASAGPMMMGPLGMPNMGMMNMGMPHQNQFMQQAPTNIQADVSAQSKVEEPVIQEEVKQSDDLSAATGDMINVLQNSENPKYRNCKFLKFLKKLEHGAYEIKDDQLHKNPQKIEEFKVIEAQRFQKDIERQQNEQKEKAQHMNQDFKNMWDGEGAMNQTQMNEMMQQWEKEGMDKEMEELMMKEWAKSWAPTEVVEKVVPLSEDNPYKDITDNLKHAKQLYQEGENHQALLHLEAEVQKNQECAEAWRMMGVIYQEFDMDDIAILAFKKAHSIDPYDLDCLLSIGISCTNELDEREAMDHLHQWLKLNPDFMDLPSLEKEKLTFDELKHAFVLASQKVPQEFKIHMALGVLSFIQRDFKGAQVYFQNAIKENPLDHSLWNKWAAALANSLNTEHALQMYQLVLQMRPKYARIWVNIGIANNTLRKYDVAATSFLNALAINPQATHLWNYLRSCLVQLGKFDLVEVLDQRDVNLFRNDFDFLDVRNLPAPDFSQIYHHPLLNE